jgi:hypothetical protein
VGALLAFAACRPASSSGDPPEQPASPQAKAEPAPIASLPLAAASAVVTPAVGVLDGGVVPQPLRADQALALDTTTKETTKEGVLGYTLEAIFRPSDVAPPAKGAEPQALEAARKKTDTRLRIDVAPTHARIVLGAGFVLPEGTEIRQRIDRFGHVVYRPDEGTYRVAAPGALRAVLGERRLDVAPESPAEVTHNGEGPRRFGRPTHKVEVATRAAKAFFELGHLTELGEGSTLLCRSLLELIGAPPATPVCTEGDVPLHADLHWTNPPVSFTQVGGGPVAAPAGGGRGRIAGTLTFDVLSVTKRLDLTTSSLAVPPPQATFIEAPFPPEAARSLLSRAELSALRPPGTLGDTPKPPGTEARLSLLNSTDELRFVWLDGVAIAWLAPAGRLDVSGLVTGRYTLEWRTFLGDAIEAAETVTLPATSDLGGGDAAPAP